MKERSITLRRVGIIFGWMLVLPLFSYAQEEIGSPYPPASLDKGVFYAEVPESIRSEENSVYEDRQQWYPANIAFSTSYTHLESQKKSDIVWVHEQKKEAIRVIRGQAKELATRLSLSSYAISNLEFQVLHTIGGVYLYCDYMVQLWQEYQPPEDSGLF